MSRTQKDTVDYFPHDADATGGDTLTALEGQFGNDGYAFWFKLLEKLCRSPGHYFDINDAKPWHSFLGRCRIDESKAVQMLELIVEMGALDRDLWQRHRVIWSQHLVDNLSEVYANRRRPVPVKPSVSPFLLITSPARHCPVCDASLQGQRSDAVFCSDACRKQGARLTSTQAPGVDATLHKGTDNVTASSLHNIVSTGNNAITTEDNAITTGKEGITTSQSIVKERREEKSREEERKEELSLFSELNKETKETITAYETNITLQPINGSMRSNLVTLCSLYSPAWVTDAIREAVLQNVLTWQYIKAILENWSKDGKPG